MKHYKKIILLMFATLVAVFVIVLWPKDEVKQESAEQPSDESIEAEGDVETESEEETAVDEKQELNEPEQIASEAADSKPAVEVAAEAPEPVSTVSVIGCGTDCTFASVDKNNQLPASYNPGGVLGAAQNDFNRLVIAANTAGQSVEVISSFRSFATQQGTFEYWVGIEMGKGKSRAQAEADANVYSAKPGHSEHQLGTTFDVKCAGCAAFDAASNSSLYSFIENNAHKFGFVISYPKNSQHLTGYTYEPWHIRWIGEDLAQELYNTGYIEGNGSYLTQFLRNKGY